MTTEHRENRSLPIRTAVEPASLLPLSAHMSYGQMRMALYNVAPDLQVSPRAQSFAHFGLHPPYHCTHHSNRGCMPDVYLEVQHPCWSCNSNSSSANASAGVR